MQVSVGFRDAQGRSGAQTSQTEHRGGDLVRCGVGQGSAHAVECEQPRTRDLGGEHLAVPYREERVRGPVHDKWSPADTRRSRAGRSGPPVCRLTRAARPTNPITTASSARRPVAPSLILNSVDPAQSEFSQRGRIRTKEPR
jgi:hypothetical protein